MDQIELACPYCTGRFSAAAAQESRVAACPQCGRSVTVPAASRQAVRPAPPDVNSSPEGRTSAGPTFAVADLPKVLVNRRGEPVPLRRFSAEERLRYRRGVNLAFALVGMLLLAVALVVLVRLRP